MELTSEEKKKLRLVYGDYKSLKMYNGDYQMFETREELKEARTNTINDFETDFPKLKENGITINDLPEHIYSKNQLQFIEDAEQTDFEIDYEYSGRGMFGDVCPCIRCDSHNDLKTKANTVIDSMGKGIVIYAQY